MNTCLHCGKETNNPKFCSRSCSVAYHNIINPKRIAKPYMPRRCVSCREPLIPDDYYYRRRVCDLCRNKNESKTLEDNYQRVKRKRKNNKIRLIELIGNKCYHCGYDKCIDALEFHHKNPNEKEFNLSCNMNRAYENLVEEAKKCIVLCANCHRELEAGLWKLE